MAKMKVSSTHVLLIALLVAGLLFLVFGCKIKCGKTLFEGFQRTGLANGSCHMTKNPVDYMNTWKANPHYKAFPGNKYQPLEQGPIDFHIDTRNAAAGLSFQEFSQHWDGVGDGQINVSPIPQDRSHLMTLGDFVASNALASALTQGHVGKAMSREEINSYRLQNHLHEGSIIHVDLQN